MGGGFPLAGGKEKVLGPSGMKESNHPGHSNSGVEHKRLPFGDMYVLWYLHTYYACRLQVVTYAYVVIFSF